VENNGFTPTQKAMLDVLSDGKRHTKEELHNCLPDELGPMANIKAHLTAIRKKIQPTGQDIVCEYRYKVFYYRWVRMITRG
jgi:hypothetical protein